MNTEHTAESDAAEVEVRECWAIRWPDGAISAAAYSDDGSDYAEQMVRKLAGGEEVVRRTETITRAPWETASPLEGRVTSPASTPGADSKGRQ